MSNRSGTCAASLVATLALALAAVPALAERLPPPAPRPGESAERAALRAEVWRAELGFAASVGAKDREKFASLVAEDAVFVSGEGVAMGREAVLAAWSTLLAPGAPEFDWWPEIVELSADGALAISRGPWVARSKGPDGSAREVRGLFTSTWRRKSDGAWEVIFDAGCAPCPSCG
jgi:ketosteroid isomerase-like protein